ncbi:MAG TPA: HAMP domain-containing sensor histidine kinase, partial [Vicinamibacterales bacterium]
ALVRQNVRGDFAAMTAEVQALARAAADDPNVPADMMRDPSDDNEGTPQLFDAAARVRLRGVDASLVAVTIYDARGIARAWAGRPSDLAPERTRSSAALFVATSPLGLRLVYLQPIVGAAPDRARLGAVAVEHVLTPAPAPSMLLTSPAYVMPRDRASVLLHPYNSAGPRPPDAFVLSGPDGAPLLDASIPPGDLAAGRSRLRHEAAALAIAVLAITILLLAGPLLDRRARTASPRVEIWLTLGMLGVVLAGGAALAASFLTARTIIGGTSAVQTDNAFTLLLAGIIASGLLAVLVPGAIRLRLARRSRRRDPARAPVSFALLQLACGVAIAAVLAGFEHLLATRVDPTSVDVRHFSLHPYSVARLTTLYGILLTHTAALWTGALCAAMALGWWRGQRRARGWWAVAAILWMLPAGALVLLARGRGWTIPGSAVILDATACAAVGLIAPALIAWYRHATIASRILALFMAFLLPALLVYPSVHFFDERSLRRLIETQYAVEALNRPQALEDALLQAMAEIDRLPRLPSLVEDASRSPRSDTAFRIWSQTALARERLTSVIELYDASGRPANRFALNFPEYGGAPDTAPVGVGCRWDGPLGEAEPFGGQERQTLLAQRSVCENGRRYGTLVVHVMFDYRTLPFMNSPSAYLDLFSPSSSSTRLEGLPSGDVDFAAYGWGLTAIYTSGQTHDAWPLDQQTFERVYRSRHPFWTTLKKGNRTYDVYFANDRLFIYALGYPLSGAFDHLVRLAELTTLAAVGYVIILIGTALFTWIARAEPQTGRALLREIRASFYRKLFIAFVLASIVPVLTLALVIRAYFAGLLLNDIQGEASRTAAVARRVIQESDALLRTGNEAVAPLGDDVMVWISQLINQDVNIFDGPSLFATSERDLFASGLLPTRTPDDVYRAIMLQRLPSFVTEDSIGAAPYMLAATPVRTGGRNAILTVPLAFRQQEVEREIDDLDRGVQLAALCFILLGAGIGLSMAERIADPVSQLTRATGRIAHGDFDARIAVRSADELRRLVDAFNGMAAELKAQRDQLERTHRLEAWAEMARQVAHEIKNPLTPIQLSAEHLRRVHADRGEPMGAVLEGCVSSILGQVRLLRQIASEFSSFASSPTARRAPADVVQLVRDVIEPYRAGLEGRIAVTNDVQPPLPLVVVDRTLVSRALANIIENALHAMPGTGALRLSARRENADVIVRIEDTGVGMDDEALARVFEPYFSTKTTGTGLGLPIARRNIELSGGSIGVASVKGQGTVVTIRLPVAEAQTPGRTEAGV